MSEHEYLCPGCDVALSPENAGGYRTWCETCVEDAPDFPEDGNGYVLEGRRGSLRWVRADGLEPVSGYVPLRRLRFERSVGDGCALDALGGLLDVIEDVGRTALSRVRLTGGCTIGGERYLYLPGDDALVREKVAGEVTA